MLKSEFEINLLQYKSLLKTQLIEGQQKIFDPIRKKYFVLQPEELVRQLVLLKMEKECNISMAKTAVEKELNIDGLRRRFDILVYDKDIKPHILVECKAFSIPITQAVFDQVAQYNQVLQSKFLIITNGRTAICAEMDYEKSTYIFHTSFPQIN